MTAQLLLSLGLGNNKCALVYLFSCRLMSSVNILEISKDISILHEPFSVYVAAMDY